MNRSKLVGWLPAALLLGTLPTGCGDEPPTGPTRSFPDAAGQTVPMEGGRRPPRFKVAWPSGRQTLQEAIDAAPDGATLEIAPGEYAVNTPVFLRGKRLIVEGAGSGRNGGTRVTHLTGPAPRAVVDREGRVILPASEVQGMFNAVGGELVLRDLSLSGHDAGVVTRDDLAGAAAPLTVNDVVIDGTGRGILALSHGAVSIEDASLAHTVWHAISACSPQEVAVANVWVTDASKVGIYLCDTHAIIADANVLYAQGGGIYMIHSGGWILNSTVFSAWEFGIGIVESDLVSTSVLLTDDSVVFTQEASGIGGDGIIGQGSTLTILDSTSSSNVRSGMTNLFGTTTLGGCSFNCNAFALDGENLSGFPAYEFINLGGNTCGCPSGGACAVQSSGIPAPDLLTDP